MKEIISIHFGAGNIGRGLIGATYNSNKIKTIFVDKNIDLVKKLNKNKEYKIQYDDKSEEIINNFEIVNKVNDINDQDIENIQFISTSIGTNNFHEIKDQIEYLFKRIKNDITIFCFENDYRATSKLKKMLNENTIKNNILWIDAIVDRIIPLKKSNDCNIFTEKYFEIVCDKTQYKDNFPLLKKDIKWSNNFDSHIVKKLWVINATHCFLAFNYNNCKYVHEIIEKYKISDDLSIWTNNIKYILVNDFEFEHNEIENYINLNIKRIFNKNLPDEIIRLKRDPIRKLKPNERLISLYRYTNKHNILDKKLISKTIINTYETTNNDHESIIIKKFIKENGIKKAFENFSELNEIEIEDLAKFIEQ